MPILVNGETITEKTIQREMDRLRADHDRTFQQMSEHEREAQLRQWSKENVIEHVLLSQEARRRNYPLDEGVLTSRFAELTKDETLNAEEVEKLKADLRLEMQFEQLMQELAEQIKPTSEQALMDYYHEHQEAFTVLERVNAAHIVAYINQNQNKIQAYQKITAIEKRLKAGEPFEQLAQSMGECREWQLGWFARGQMVQSFENAVFSLKPGQISGIILTEYGYHIAKVYDYQPEQLIPFEEVRQQIAEQMKQERLQDKLFELVDALKEKAVIVEGED